MREVIIKQNCDACWQDGELKTPSAGAWTIGIVAGESGRPALKVLDLCEQHTKLVTDLVALLADVELTPDKPGPEPRLFDAPRRTTSPGNLRVVACPVCRQEINRSSMVGHIWSQHRTDRKPDQPPTCPECREPYGNGQGMATHRRIVHGFDAVVDALGGVKGYKVTGREGEL